MSLQPLPAARFVRRTSLGPNEYRRNFRQLDLEVITAVTSVEADGVTPLMGKIYLRLVSAPAEFWEREGVLYFAPRAGDGRPVKASKVLYEVLGVASATAHKALQWLHGQGIIGYFAGKNGVGIRIFLNRAVSSIGARTSETSKKILPFAHGSNGMTHGSTTEPAFKDSFADPESLDSDLDPRAPENGADSPKEVNTPPAPAPQPKPKPDSRSADEETGGRTARALHLEEITDRLLRGLEPAVRAAAAEAAAREHERTRAWLESRGLPKAARVAQREAYNVLRQYGAIKATAPASSADMGQHGGYSTPAPHPLPEAEIAELAQACVAMLEAQGQAVELTLNGMSDGAGGFLIPDDAARVRTQVALLLGDCPCEASE